MDRPAATVASSPTLAPRPSSVTLTPETANQLTHGLGLVLSLAGAVVLLQAAAASGSGWQLWGCRVYAATLIALYAASTLSHSFPPGAWREFFRTLDQVCIFLLIAGTFTPFALTFLLDGWWPLLIAAMWGLTLAGIVFKLFVRRLRNVAVGLYVALGWLPILAVERMLDTVQRSGLFWILAGGLFYTSGTWFLKRDVRNPYWHAVWHLFVIAGSICHFVVIRWYVVG
ncbi:MAG TPA: hemolysin III family protein [Planctomycetaceae bacterium]|nr:hemolysin III family protein [Planctomycetaceae bacterium]